MGGRDKMLVPPIQIMYNDHAPTLKNYSVDTAEKPVKVNSEGVGLRPF